MPSFEKILSQAQDDVLIEGFQMRGLKVFLPSYLVSIRRLISKSHKIASVKIVSIKIASLGMTYR